MNELLEFSDRYHDDAAYITALAKLKWPRGFACRRCQYGEAWPLKSRPHVFACRACGYQESVTAENTLGFITYCGA